MSDDVPQPERLIGALHPRDTPRLIGQDAAEGAFLTAYNSGKLHHAWLLSGPRGVGKATLAWRIARFLLTEEKAETGMFGDMPDAKPERLDVRVDHPVLQRILAGSEPRLFRITRSVEEKSKRLRDVIVVDDVRKLGHFLSMSAAEGGRRVVILDAADEMNTQAANALLKMLEEPPARTTLLLISHQPSRLLPTIRSRCRTLRLGPLQPDDMQAALEQAGAELPDDPTYLAALAAGSVGAAMRLLSLEGMKLYAELLAIADSLPRLDRQRAMALAEKAATRGGAERFELMLTLIDLLLVRLARTGATGQPPMPEAAPNEGGVLSRLSPDPHRARAWADLAATVTERSRHGQAVNLDPAALVLDTVFKMQDTASR